MSQKWLYRLFCGGVLLLVLGGVMIPVVDVRIRKEIRERVLISNTSELWDIWSEPPIPIFMQFYMFNLSNPIEVKNGQKPVVVQYGPYTYQEKRKKYNIIFNSNGTVTYRQKRTFFFLKNMSVGDDTDLFVTANPPVVAVINSLQYVPTAIREAVNIGLMTFGEDIFMTRPVKEILWGYTDPSLTVLKKLFPAWFYTDFVGFFINKNDTDDGLYTVFTGSNNVSTLGLIDAYNGSRFLPYWSTKWANMVNGSDGTISPPFEQDVDTLRMFSSDICRSVSGAFQKNVKTKRNISLRRYVGTKAELENATANPDNRGFCTPSHQCLPTGLLNISNCQIVDDFHIPVVVSFPHFYLADPDLIQQVSGMKPVAEEHETAVDVEPWTDLVLQAYKRLQINMYLEKVDSVSLTGNIKTMFLPVFWLNESAVVDDKHAAMLQRELFLPLEITSVLEKVFMITGSVLVLLVLVVTYRNYRNRKSCDLPSDPVCKPSAEEEDEREPLIAEKHDR